MAYALSCCSTVDLTEERLAELDVRWASFHYIINGVEHADDFGKSLAYEKFYQTMVAGADVKTSQVNVSELVAHFNKIIADGHEKILHISFSSGLSGTCSAAKIAAAEVMMENANARILVVDSLAASAGYGLLVQTAAEKRKEGAGFRELYRWLEGNKLQVHHWFYSTDLTFFVKGGRVSRTSGLIGGMLSICPLLSVDSAGHLVARENIRTKRKATEAALERMVQFARDGVGYDGRVFISHSACRGDAEVLAEMINDMFPNLAAPVELFDIGTTIGTHTGPGTVALFFWGSERAD